MTPPTQAVARQVPPGLQPLAPNRPRAEASRDEPAATRILVLDGDRERRDLLGDAVVRAGGEPAFVHTGAEAIERLRAGDAEPRVLLVGGLSDGSRRGFVAWVRPRFAERGIVALAADAAEATDLYHAGADIVMTLPLDPDLLGAKLAASLRRSGDSRGG